MLPRGLIGLGLICNNSGIRGDCPIESGVEGNVGGRGEVKEEDDDKEGCDVWTNISAYL